MSEGFQMRIPAGSHPVSRPRDDDVGVMEGVLSRSCTAFALLLIFATASCSAASSGSSITAQPSRSTSRIEEFGGLAYLPDTCVHERAHPVLRCIVRWVHEPGQPLMAGWGARSGVGVTWTSPDLDNQPVVIRVAAADAQEWIRGSLSRGSTLAMLLTRRLAEPSSAWLLAPKDQVDLASLMLDDRGRGMRTSDADRVASRFLEVLRIAGAATVVVEDDLARRGDPHLVETSCFVDDRVLHWAQLASGTDDGVRALRSGASGYPLNAYVCPRTASDLGLEAQHRLRSAELEAIVDATSAIISSVYDAEAYLAVVFGDVGSDFENAFLVG